MYLWKFAFSIIMVMLLSACGGDDSSNGDSTPNDNNNTNTEMSNSNSDGIINNNLANRNNLSDNISNNNRGNVSNNSDSNSNNNRNIKDKTPPVIKILGDNPVDVIQNTIYKDAGATAEDKIDGKVKVKSTGKVNTHKVGKYKIVYTAVDKSGNKATATRIVNVILAPDKTPPVIKILGDNPVDVIQNTTYKDAGATAEDKIDGKVKVKSTGKVNTHKIGQYKIVYTAVDKSGNKATATRIVNVILAPDKTPPVITISGDNPLEVTQGDTFSDPGATATDDRDGEVAVTPIGSVDMSVVGDYNITYTATDSAGNEANATRIVTVLPNEVIWNVSNVTEFRQALEDASANGENDKIVLSAGVYNVDSDGLGTFSFDDNEEFNLTITSAEGLNRNDVILDGNNTCQVFNFDNTQNSTLILKGISIVDGNSTAEGGGVYTNHNIKVEDCNISNNISSSNGGGLSSNGTTTVINSSIFNNISGNNGGGFYSNSTTTVSNSNIFNNNSDDGGGFYSNGTTTVTNLTVSNNNSNDDCGGFWSEGVTLITNSTISNNIAGGDSGGFFSRQKTTITNSTINNNNSNDDGGGFYSNGATTVINSTISNNHVNIEDCGGFRISEQAGLNVKNSVISNNSSRRAGGICSNGSMTINNSAIFNNRARNEGGGIYAYRLLFNYGIQNIIIVNSIFYKNQAKNGTSLYTDNGDAYFYLSNNNFIETDNNISSIYAQGVFVNNIFNSNGDIDIDLYGNSKIYNNYIDYTKIEDNGHNIIKKHNLQPSSVGDVYLNNDNETLASNSPVIDKGLNPSSVTYKKIIDNDNIYNQIIELLKTDKVGNKRIYNEIIDMGAVEYRANP